MKQIQLTNNKYALVNDEDYEFLNQWKWQFGGDGYAIRTDRQLSKRTIYMHRVILGTTGITDHKDGDRLNNQRTNLRPATINQNTWNRRKQPESVYGVRNNHGSYQARISKKGKPYIIGTFPTEHYAALAHDLWARELHGEFATTNFKIEQFN